MIPNNDFNMVVYFNNILVIFELFINNR
ncbi:hypothetical protein c7_L14 [Megavirus courdo7]|uniref:Uncharacterized protein n=1 Tax=Megavirus courdo7 TaxID=1128135 RepID=H2E9K7_9VIRU|nr:hypothetical protein c7_L14 [Megavirus courdo7]